MKVRIDKFNAEHENLLCLLRWTTKHLEADPGMGLRDDSMIVVFTRHVLVGKPTKITPTELHFGRCHHCRTEFSRTFHRHPYLTEEWNTIINRDVLDPREIVIVDAGTAQRSSVWLSLYKKSLRVPLSEFYLFEKVLDPQGEKRPR